MREIREMIAELTFSYEKQLEIYKEIQKVGSREQGLISNRQLDVLLQVLREKETLLKQAGDFETRIKSTQDSLTRHFEVNTFSLVQLKKVAPTRYQKDLELLEEVIAELVPVLELLEEQERRNETILNQYLEHTKRGSSKQVQIRRANRAYHHEKS